MTNRSARSAACAPGPARSGIIVLADGLPRTVEKIEKGCITCGHCVAVCPTAALSHCRMTPEECSPLTADWRLTPQQIELLVKGRRSIRRYRPEPVDRAVLEKLLEIVRYAPTGGNSQSVQWLVMSDPEEIDRLSSIVVDWLRILLVQGVPGMKGLLKSWEMGSDPILRNAPNLIIAHGAVDDSMVKNLIHHRPGHPGTGFPFIRSRRLLGRFPPPCSAKLLPKFMNSLCLPPGHQMCGGLMIGYPEFEYARIPARRQASVSWR